MLGLRRIGVFAVALIWLAPIVGCGSSSGDIPPVNLGSFSLQGVHFDYPKNWDVQMGPHYNEAGEYWWVEWIPAEKWREATADVILRVKPLTLVQMDETGNESGRIDWAQRRFEEWTYLDDVNLGEAQLMTLDAYPALEFPAHGTGTWYTGDPYAVRGRFFVVFHDDVAVALYVYAEYRSGWDEWHDVYELYLRIRDSLSFGGAGLSEGAVPAGLGEEPDSGSSAAGAVLYTVYVNAQDAEQTLTIHSDGTYRIGGGGAAFLGRWQLTDDVLTLSWIEKELQFAVAGKRLSDDEGTAWVADEEAEVLALPEPTAVARGTPSVTPWPEGIGWSVRYGGKGDDCAFSLDMAGDGGYVVAGMTQSQGPDGQDVWVGKTDENGLLQWEKEFGGVGRDVGKCIRHTTDGGYIVVAVTGAGGTGNEDSWLIKLDAEGNMEWDRRFGAGQNDSAESVCQTSDGGYVFTGYTNSNASFNTDLWVVKTDAAGNREWEKSYGESGADRGKSVRQTADGGYIIGGSMASEETGQVSGWLMKLDVAGHLQWQRILSTPVNEACEVWDGGYVVTGSKLVRTDAVGGIEWEAAFYEGTGHQGSSVRQTADGGFIVAGYTLNEGSDYCPIWLVKFNKEGEQQWMSLFGGSRCDRAYAVEEIDDGYILAGCTESFGFGANDVWLLKTDTRGVMIQAQPPAETENGFSN